MKKARYWMPAILLMAIIFYASSQPYEKQDIRPLLGEKISAQWVERTFSGISFQYGDSEVSVKAKGAAGFMEFIIRKLSHMSEFALLAIFYWWGNSRTWLRGRSFAPYLYAWFMVVLYASSDEIHQTFTPNRTGMWQDVVVDSTGAAIGLILLSVAIRRKA